MQHFLLLSPKLLTLPPPSLCGRSLGVLVFECCCGYPPFHAQTMLQTFYNITMKAPAFPTESKVRLESHEGIGACTVYALRSRAMRHRKQGGGKHRPGKKRTGRVEGKDSRAPSASSAITSHASFSSRAYASHTVHTLLTHLAASVHLFRPCPSAGEPALPELHPQPAEAKARVSTWLQGRGGRAAPAPLPYIRRLSCCTSPCLRQYASHGRIASWPAPIRPEQQGGGRTSCLLWSHLPQLCRQTCIYCPCSLFKKVSRLGTVWCLGARVNLMACGL